MLRIINNRLSTSWIPNISMRAYRAGRRRKSETSERRGGRQERRCCRRQPRKLTTARSNDPCTFDLGDVRVVLAPAAYVVDPRRYILEALITILGVPLRGRPIVRAQVLGTAGPPVRQALLRGKPREGRDRAGLAAVAVHAVTVALIGRVLEGVLLAGSPAGLRQGTLLNDRGVRVVPARPYLPHALSHGDLLELHDLGTVQLALLHQPLEALLERGVARPGGRTPVHGRPEGRSARVLQEILGAGSAPSRPDLLEEAHPVAQPATTWRSRTAISAARAVHSRRGRTTSGWGCPRHIRILFSVHRHRPCSGITNRHGISLAGHALFPLVSHPGTVAIRHLFFRHHTPCTGLHMPSARRCHLPLFGDYRGARAANERVDSGSVNPDRANRSPMRCTSRCFRTDGGAEGALAYGVCVGGCARARARRYVHMRVWCIYAERAHGMHEYGMYVRRPCATDAGSILPALSGPPPSVSATSYHRAVPTAPVDDDATRSAGRLDRVSPSAGNSERLILAFSYSSLDQFPHPACLSLPRPLWYTCDTGRRIDRRCGRFSGVASLTCRDFDRFEINQCSCGERPRYVVNIVRFNIVGYMEQVMLS